MNHPYLPYRAVPAMLAGFIALVVATSACHAQKIVVTPVKASGVYDLGEKIGWHVQVVGPEAKEVTHAHYRLKHNGLTPMTDGELDLSSGQADIQTSLNEPGAVLLEIHSSVDGEDVRTLAGAIVDPHNIAPSLPRPADFDAFWADKIEQLHQIPINPVLVPGDGGSANVDYYTIQMDGISGSHIHGQLAKPRGDGKYPALLVLQWAGIYGLPPSRVVDRAKHGWLCLNIEPHDLPSDRPAAFYRALARTSMRNYYIWDDNNRDKTYFLRMYLSAYRAIDYLAGRDDWDGKTLVVMGTSMGGQQTVVMAGLHPKVTAMMACVPSSCDLTGPKVGRAAAFPDWAKQADLKHDDSIYQAGRYYDPMNFASHIHCPALVALGLIDETCPSAGVFAAFNQIAGPKQVLVMVNSDHSGINNSQAPYIKRSEEWLGALVKGEEPPVQ